MGSPSRRPGNRVIAEGAESALAEPQTKELQPSFGISLHLEVKPTLEVDFPTRVVRVCKPFDLDVSDDWDRRSPEEADDLRIALKVAVPLAEDPMAAIEVFK